jgi:hypothetical protein
MSSAFALGFAFARETLNPVPQLLHLIFELPPILLTVVERALESQ